jgi:hypothetical protein
MQEGGSLRIQEVLQLRYLYGNQGGQGRGDRNLALAA